MPAKAEKRPILCLVDSCINNDILTRIPSERVFYFPRGKGPTKKAVIGWLQFVNELEDLQHFLRTGHYVTRFRALGICQRHFAPHQFATPDKTRLVRGAIPLFHDPDDALLPSGCLNDDQSTVRSCGGVKNTDDTRRAEKTHLIKEEIQAILEGDNSQSNWQSQDSINVIHEVDLGSEYLNCTSQEDNDLLGSQKPDKEAVTECQKAKKIKLESSVYEKFSRVVSLSPASGESSKCISENKNYNKGINENASSFSDKMQDESETFYENEGAMSAELLNDKCESELHYENQETVSDELILLAGEWETLPEEICRLCASTEQHLKQPITNWIKMLMKLIPETIALDDGLPQYMCRSCAEKLCLCIEIQQSFTDSYNKLKTELTECEMLETETEVMSDYPDCDNPTALELEDKNSELTNSALDKLICDGKTEELCIISSEKNNKIKQKVKKYSFICMECEELFISSKALRLHMKSRHEIERCECCNKNFVSSCELEEHLRTHTDETKFKCQCGTEVESIKRFKDHLMNHKPPKFSCSICCKSFRNYFEMRHHEKGHRKSICEICGKQMKNDSYLKVHVRMHTGERPFQCELCGVSFTTSDRYYIHRYKKHSSERFPCDICGKILFTENSFERHKSGHEKGKQYKCEICLLDFRYEFSKLLHQRAKCSTCLCIVCKLVFPSVQELLEHRSKEHLEEETTRAAFEYRDQRTYDCNICSKSFKKSESLSNHIRNIHRKQEESCAEFSHGEVKVSSKVCKIFSCLKCEEKFKTRKALILHSASNHKDGHHNLSCSYCKEEFEEFDALITHQNQHLKDKVFTCCNWVFCSKADFERHKRFHCQNISDITFEDENYADATELNIVLPSQVLT